MKHPRFVRIPRFSELTGYSEGAVSKMIERGVWVQGIHFKRHGRTILMDLEEYDKWAEKCAA